MNKEYETLPYRKNVCLITFKGEKFLLLNLIYWKDNWWKFPQGGIKVGETLEEAGRREFKEELGTDKIEILGESKILNRYDWKTKKIELKDKRWKGQSQRFLLARFTGEDSDLKPNPEEVKTYRWTTREEILAYSRKKDHMFFQNYNGEIPNVLEEFSELMKNK
jgi:putative (di)nucleoside polyphosphate hydrolase